MDKFTGKTTVLVILLVISMMVIAGCTSPTTTPTVSATPTPSVKPTPGNYTITWIDGGDPRGLDPANDYESVGIGIIQNVYETLLYYDGPGTTMDDLKGVLATAWNKSSDGLTYTFYLRKGVKFHDGTDFNASAVKYSFERGVIQNQLTWKYLLTDYMLGGKVYRLSNHTQADIDQFKALDTFHVVNDSCIQVKLEKPYAPFAYMMTFSGASIISPTFVEANGGYKPLARNNSYLYDHMCGTGPFKFVSWEPKNKIVLDRFNEYWQGPAPAAKIVIRNIEDTNQRMLALQTGEADVITAQTLYDKQIRNMSGVQVAFMNESVAIDYAAMNFGIPPFDNPKVRQAFVESFDYKTYIDKVYNGYGLHPNGPIPVGLNGYDASLPAQKFDPVNAKKLFEEAGFNKSNPTKITIYTNTENDARPVLGQMLQQQINTYDLGITVDLQEMQWSVMLEKAENAELPIFILGWLGDIPDADNFLTAICHSQGYCAYESNYANASVDELIDLQMYESDPVKRQQLINAAVNGVNSDNAFIWIRQGVFYYPHRDTLKGIAHNPMDSSLIFYTMYK